MCRLLRGGGTKATVIDVLLVVGLIVFILYFLKRQGIMFGSNRREFGSSSDFTGQQGTSGRPGSRTVLPGAPASGPQGQAGAQNQIEARIKLIADQRSDKCKTEKYDKLKEMVSIVMVFYDYQFYNLRTTISSILNVDSSRIAEIIIVDDGSTLKYIMDDCDAYVKSLRGVRLIRHKTQIGQLKSRLAGYNEAKSDIVMFLDVTVVVSRGWLEPIIDLLVSFPNIIAMPHYDHILDPVTMDYRHTPINLVASWSWNLAIRMRLTPDTRILQDSRFITSPAVSGSAFAVRKAFLNSLGSLDEGMEDGGGEYLDLSLKTWFCHGSIMIATCSRVGVTALPHPQTVRTRSNRRHLIQTYFGSYAEAALRLNTLTPGIQTRRSGSKDPLDLSKCREMHWYLKNIRNETKPPSAEALHFGVLRVHSGRCARIDPTDNRVELHSCPDSAHTEPPVEYTTTRRLRLTDGRCLMTSPSAFILADQCRANDTRQDWTYKENFELVNTWSGFCARHVTDPDSNSTHSRQIAMAQRCSGEPTKNDIFKQWSFLSV